MDKLILAQKLESLRRCLQRVEQKCPATKNPRTKPQNSFYINYRDISWREAGFCFKRGVDEAPGSIRFIAETNGYLILLELIIPRRYMNLT